MPLKFTLFCAAAFLVIFSSCHKHNDRSSSKNALNGTWNFGSYSTNTVINTATVNKDSFIIVSKFTTIDNKGAVTFDGSTMAVNGLGYVIDTTASVTAYVSGFNLGATPILIKDTVPATSYAVNYQLVGTDSIYFPLGGFSASVGLSTGETIAINGAHYTIDGNKLTLTSSMVQADTINEGGHAYPAVTQIQSTIVMNKQ